MFEVSTKTIYSKFKNEKIKKYVKNTNKGKRLEQEGINEFQILMVETKLNSNRVKPDKQEITFNNHHIPNNELVNTLKQQIEDLKNDKKEMLEREKDLMKMINEKDSVIERQTFTLEHSQKLLIESKNEVDKLKSKKSILNKIFKFG